MTTRSKSKNVRISRPRHRLTDLVDRPGGLPRAKAIADATRRVEAQRGPAIKALDDFINALEDIMMHGSSAPSNGLDDMRRITGQLISLATIYGMTALAQAGERLCDLAMIFTEIDESNAEAINVHLRSLRLLSSCESPGIAEGVLGELDKIMVHYGVARPGVPLAL